MLVLPPQPYDVLPVQQQQLIDIAIFTVEVARIHGYPNSKLSKVELPDDNEKRIVILRELFAKDLQSLEQHYIELPGKHAMQNIILPLLFTIQSGAILGADQDIRVPVRKKGAGIRTRQQFEDAVGDTVTANRQLRDLIGLLTNLPYDDTPYIEDAAVSLAKSR